MSRDLGHVVDVVASAARITKYVSAVSLDEFLQDDMRQSAVLHQFTIIGEACRRISSDRITFEITSSGVIPSIKCEA